MIRPAHTIPLLLKVMFVALALWTLAVAGLITCGCAPAARPDPLAPVRVASNRAADVLTTAAERHTQAVKADAREGFAACDRVVLPPAERVTCRETAVENALSKASPASARLERLIALQHVIAGALETAETCRVAERQACFDEATARALALRPELETLVAAVRQEIAR